MEIDIMIFFWHTVHCRCIQKASKKCHVKRRTFPQMSVSTVFSLLAQGLCIRANRTARVVTCRHGSVACWTSTPNLDWHPKTVQVCYIYEKDKLQVVPGRAGGGSFRRKKNYIAKKEFAYRMCARRPTSAMPKPFLCCERAFCCSMVVMWPVLMHVMSFDVVVMSFDAMWLLVLRHVTWYNAMSCDVPCNGHVVCSVFEVVLCNTAPATQNYCDDWSASHMKGWFTMSGATGITIHLHQILHLARKMNAISDPRHIWNVISNARASKVTLQTHQLLRLPRKMNPMIDPRHIWNVI